MSLNTPTFQSGDKCLVKTGTITFPANSWKLPIDGKNKAVPNGRDGRKRIPGLPDVEGGELMMPYDTANDPTTVAAGGVTVGAILDVKFFVDATHFWELSIIVDSIEPGAEFDGELQFPVKFSLAGGTITPPAYGS